MRTQQLLSVLNLILFLASPTHQATLWVNIHLIPSSPQPYGCFVHMMTEVREAKSLAQNHTAELILESRLPAPNTQVELNFSGLPPGEGSSEPGLEAHGWPFLQGGVHPERSVTIAGTGAGFQPCHGGARLQLVCQPAQRRSLSAQAGHGHVQRAPTRARPRTCAACPRLPWPAPTCPLPQ